MRNALLRVATVLLVALTALPGVADQPQSDDQSTSQTKDDGMQVVTLGGGCFWCVEAVFQRLEGVEQVVSGYMGGKVPNPTYKMVTTGRTGHAEVCQITFDPSVVSFDTLLEVFWKTHDPTTLNRQGNDVGTQYRSVIFYHTDEQKEIAESYKSKLNKEKAFGGRRAVTEISAAETFYRAEDYHQNYFNQNPGQGYCRFVVAPKVEKFNKIFADKAKKKQ